MWTKNEAATTLNAGLHKQLVNGVPLTNWFVKEDFVHIDCERTGMTRQKKCVQDETKKAQAAQTVF